MDENIQRCTAKRCNIDVLCEEVGPDTFVYGARLRPWSRDGRGRMVLGASSSSWAQALDQAVAKAAEGRWEVLDWAKRPWAQKAAQDAW